MCQDNSLSIVTGYGWDDRISDPRTDRIFSACRHVQTSYGAHTSFYEIGIGGSYVGDVSNEREHYHSLPSRAEVMKSWLYTSTPPYAFLAFVFNYPQRTFYISLYPYH
jgi:hypothetical protein